MKYYVKLSRFSQVLPCGRLLPLTSRGHVVRIDGKITFSTASTLSREDSFIVEISE